MVVLFYGLILFFLGFLFQIVVWRFYLPRNQTKIIIYFFISIFICGFLFLPNFSFNQYWQLILLYISLVGAYIITYSAIEAQSPSLDIVMRIGDAGVQGLRQGTLFTAMNDDLLVRPRVDDLIQAKMIVMVDGKYSLTLLGSLFIKIFLFYRRLLKKNKGG